MHSDNLEPLISLPEQVFPVKHRPLLASKQGKHEKVRLRHSHFTFSTLRNDEVVDEKDRPIIPSFKGWDERLQHSDRLFVIVVVEGCTVEIDTGIADRLWRVVVVELVLDTIAKILDIRILELLRRPVLNGERKILEFLSVVCQLGHDSYTREIDGDVPITTSNINNFLIGKSAPIIIVTQDLEAVVDCFDVSLSP
jgi:hypothetical protein